MSTRRWVTPLCSHISVLTHHLCVCCAVGVYPDTFSQPFRYDHVALQQAAPQSVPLTAQPAALGALLLQESSCVEAEDFHVCECGACCVGGYIFCPALQQWL